MFISRQEPLNSHNDITESIFSLDANSSRFMCRICNILVSCPVLVEERIWLVPVSEVNRLLMQISGASATNDINVRQKTQEDKDPCLQCSFIANGQTNKLTTQDTNSDQFHSWWSLEHADRKLSC